MQENPAILRAQLKEAENKARKYKALQIAGKELDAAILEARRVYAAKVAEIKKQFGEKEE